MRCTSFQTGRTLTVQAQQIRAASNCGSTATQFGGFLDSLSATTGGQGMGQTFWG